MFKEIEQKKELLYRMAALEKEAAYDAKVFDFNENGKILAIEQAFPDDEVAREVVYMLATSHEYKRPNTKPTIGFAKNYKWTKKTMPIKNLQGIDKPVDQSKVLDIAKNIRVPKPLIVVDKMDGIRPQTRGKRILLDGHHRKYAYLEKGWSDTPVYHGEYIGSDSITMTELGLPPLPKNRRPSFGFDFDGTIHDGDVRKLGKPIEPVVTLMKLVRKLGGLIIIDTNRNGKLLAEMEQFLKKWNVPYDTIGSNPDFESGSRKVYADVKIDDRSINASQATLLLELLQRGN